MNKDILIGMRGNLRIIISAYERFLEKEITTKASITAIEALSTRDIIRTVGMSEVSQKRVNKILSNTDDNETSETSVSSVEEPLFAEGAAIGTALQPSEREGSSSDSLFKDLEDCIPCNKAWKWKDFNWDALRKLLELDLKNRFKWLSDFDLSLSDNEVLDRLCQFINAFKNLCPQDLLVLISLFVTWLIKTIESIKFNLDGIISDILGMIFRPYIAGLEDFLNAYIQFYVNQIECILNAILVTTSELEGLKISNTLGPDQIHFEADVITGRGDAVLNKTGEITNRVKKLVNEDRKDLLHTIANDWPAQLIGLADDAIEWVELQAIRAQDMVIDILGGEWLVTTSNLSLAQQMKNVSTIIQILKAIYNLGNLGELCTEDNVRKIIDSINTQIPDTIVIAEDASERSREANPSVNNISSPGSNLTDDPKSSKEFSFSLSSCLQRPGDISETLLQEWINELG